MPNLDILLTWLVRFVHVASAAIWVGGYAVMVFAIVPALARTGDESIRQLGLTTARVISIAGTLTILGGLALISRSRGYGLLLGGEWGGIVITSAVLAVGLMALGDSGLRPAIRRMQAGPDGGGRRAQRWAVAGLLIGVLTLGLMTRTIYAR